MPVSTKLSTIWIFVMINMGFADILGFMYPGTLDKIATGTVDGVTITPMFLLIAAVFVEIGIAMILISRLAPRGLARIANIVAAPVTIVFIIAGGSLTPHYIFFAAIEVMALIAITALAWSWTDSAEPARA